MNLNIKSIIKNNKKMTALLLVAIILIFSGNLLSETGNDETNYQQQFKSEKIDEEKLEKILSNIEGAGKVNVFITYENKGIIEYLSDTKTVTDDGVSNEKKHVFANKEPVVNSYVNAQVRGVIVTATGASDINVKNSLLKAVKAVTGAGYDRISVETGV